jgi:hypothetical protein
MPKGSQQNLVRERVLRRRAGTTGVGTDGSVDIWNYAKFRIGDA